MKETCGSQFIWSILVASYRDGTKNLIAQQNKTVHHTPHTIQRYIIGIQQDLGGMF
jgi:hypothetical protein